MEKIKEKKMCLSDKYYKLLGMITGCLVTGTPLMALAGTVKIKLGSKTSPSAVAGGIVEVIITIFTYIGILLLAWSIGMLVMAFRNEDADSKSRAIMLMVVSVFLIGIKQLLKTAQVIE